MRNRAFTGPDAEQRYQRAGMWLLAAVFESDRACEWCGKNGIALRKAQGENTNSAGGFLVPVELANAIFDLRDLYGAFRARARIVAMGSDSARAPRRTGGTTAYFVGENIGITEATGTVDGLGLNARKLAALVRLSTELDEDSLPDLVDYIANEMAFAFAQKEDDCAFNGDGSSTYGQMVGIAALPSGYKSRLTAAHNTYLTLDAADIGNLIGSVRASAIGNGAWFISNLGFATAMCRLSAAAGGEIGMVNGAPTYLGWPVALTQKLPQIATSLSGKLMLAFGDMYAAGALGQRRGITIARSDERYMDSDQIAIRATERVHCVIHDTGDASNYGAIAGLFGS